MVLFRFPQCQYPASGPAMPYTPGQTSSSPASTLTSNLTFTTASRILALCLSTICLTLLGMSWSSLSPTPWGIRTPLTSLASLTTRCLIPSPTCLSCLLIASTHVATSLSIFFSNAASFDMDFFLRRRAVGQGTKNRGKAALYLPYAVRGNRQLTNPSPVETPASTTPDGTALARAGRRRPRQSRTQGTTAAASFRRTRASAAGSHGPHRPAGTAAGTDRLAPPASRSFVAWPGPPGRCGGRSGRRWSAAM